MTPDARSESDAGPDHDTDASSAENAATDQARSTDSDDDSATTDPALEVIVDPDRLGAALDGAAALVDECRLVVDDDGLLLRARDPADVAMAELSLYPESFESFAAENRAFGIALDRFRDAVSMVDDGPLRVSLGDDGRFHVEASAVEYALAPFAPDAVRAVEWIDADEVARVGLSAADLERSVRAADLVADHLTFAVDADEETLVASASGDTDDVELEFRADDCSEFEAGPVESLYAVDYLRRIVGSIPADTTVTLAFLDTADAAGRPLAVRYSFADGTGSARWLVAPRIPR